MGISSVFFLSRIAQTSISRDNTHPFSFYFKITTINTEYRFKIGFCFVLFENALLKLHCNPKARNDASCLLLDGAHPVLLLHEGGILI